MGGLTFSILGPLEVRHEGHSLTPAGQTPRMLLALLLLRANQVVAADELIESLWREPPPSAANALQVHVSRLRKHLASADPTATDPRDVLLTRRPGYMVRVDEGALDAQRFQTLAEEGAAAMAAGAPAIAAPKLDEALGLWRGPLLGDLMYEAGIEEESARWEDLRLAVQENRIEADLQLGKHAELVGELRALCTENPFRERFHAQLMLALYRSGRQADALQTFQETRDRLVEELGVEPSAQVRALHDQVLNQDRALDVSGSREAGPVQIDESSGTLPMVGREREMAALDDALRLATRGRRVVVAVEGPAGHGKTRLLEEWMGGLDRTGIDVRRASAFRARGSFPGELATRLRLTEQPPSASTVTSVLVVDDLQWADALSQGLLSDTIASSRRDASSLLVLAHRPVSGSQRATIDRVIASAGADGEQLILRLRGLRPHDLVPLLSGDAPLQTAGSLIEASQGIPFELQRTIKELVRAGVARFEGGKLALEKEIPADLSGATSYSLEDLAGEERRLVEVVCLARAPLGSRTAEQIVGLEEGMADVLITESAAGRLLARTPDGLVPVHDLAADAVIEQIDETSTTQMLRALAKQVRSEGAAGTALAGSYLVEAGYDEEAVPLLAEGGAGLIEGGSHADSIPVLDAAIAALGRCGPNDELEALLRRKRALAFNFMGLFDRALADLRAAEKVDHRMTVESLRISAYLSSDQGRLPEAELSAALAVAEATRGQDPREIALSLVQHAFYLSALGFVEEPRVLIDKAAPLAKDLGEAELFELNFWAATIPAWENDVRASEPAWRKLVESARTMGDSAFSDTAPWLARDLLFMGRVDEGLGLCEEAIRVAQATGSAMGLTALSNGAWGLASCGLYTDALAWANDELELLIPIPHYEFDPRLHRSIALLGGGRVEEARDELENTLALIENLTDAWHIHVRCRVQELAVIAGEGGRWPVEEAAALTHELRKTRRLIPLAEVLSMRARQEDQPELAIEGVDIGLDIGSPMVAARAAHAGALWTTTLGTTVAHRVRDMSRSVPTEMFEEWAAQPCVIAALAVSR